MSPAHGGPASLEILVGKHMLVGTEQMGMQTYLLLSILAVVLVGQVLVVRAMMIMTQRMQQLEECTQTVIAKQAAEAADLCDVPRGLKSHHQHNSGRLARGPLGDANQVLLRTPSVGENGPLTKQDLPTRTPSAGENGPWTKQGPTRTSSSGRTPSQERMGPTRTSSSGISFTSV